uniref:Putative immunoglobulin A1 protease n=1 Tax=Siphoviridae sp. ctTC45 TaxID=2827573 RepID=A0A8S5LQ49_9CAUD|nr:MAG TPA: putative immunoglobulin A1 protease [Siphoviridae sp. ctTC45]
MATGLWTDYKASSFAGGSGTSSSPYQISNAAQLAYMAYLVNSNTTYRNKYYQLTADIDLSAHYWYPIGKENYSFNGTFDGQYHTISNMTIDNTVTGMGVKYLGLFGYIGKYNLTVTIKNLFMNNAMITDSSATYASFLVGHNGDKLYLNNISIDNSELVYASSTTVSTTGTYFGGLVGYSNNLLSIDNANIYKTNIRSNKEMTGGCIGYCNNTGSLTITNVNSIIDELMTSNTVAKLGGLVGEVEIKTGSYITIQYISVYIKDSAGSGSYYGGLIGYVVQYSSYYTTYLKILDSITDVTLILSKGTFKTYVGGWKYSPVESTIKSRMSNLWYNSNSTNNNGAYSGLFTSTDSTDVVTAVDFSASNSATVNSDWSSTLRIYNAAYHLACRKFSVETLQSGSVTYRNIILLNDMYTRKHSLVPIKMLLIMDMGGDNPYEENLTTGKYFLVTGTSFTLPKADKYSYLEQKLNLRSLTDSDKYLSKSLESEATSVYYSPSDTINNITTDIYLWTDSIDTTKILTYKKDNSTIVNIEDIYDKTTSSTMKVITDYKYRKDSSTMV